MSFTPDMPVHSSRPLHRRSAAAGHEVQDDEHRPRVAAGAVGSFIADGAGGGPTVTMFGVATKVGAGETAIARATKP